MKIRSRSKNIWKTGKTLTGTVNNDRSNNDYTIQYIKYAICMCFDKIKITVFNKCFIHCTCSIISLKYFVYKSIYFVLFFFIV